MLYSLHQLREKWGEQKKGREREAEKEKENGTGWKRKGGQGRPVNITESTQIEQKPKRMTKENISNINVKNYSVIFRQVVHMIVTKYYHYYYNHFTAFVQDYIGEAVPEG